MRLKKIIFYIPLIILLAICGLVAMLIRDIKITSPTFLMWLVLFLMSGILLSRGVFWGSVFGMLSAIHEIPIGIIVLIFYMICGVSVCYKNKE